MIYGAPIFFMNIHSQTVIATNRSARITAIDVRLRARLADPARRDRRQRVQLRGELALRRLHRLPLLLPLRRRPHAPHEPAQAPRGGTRGARRRKVRVRASAADLQGHNSLML